MRNTLLQCVTVCSSALQCVCSVYISSMQRYVYERHVVAVCCSVQQWVAACLIVHILDTQRHVYERHVVAVCCSVLQCVAVCCSVSVLYVFQYAET